MTDKHREPDWSAWNNWCDSRIDARRSFDREVFVEVIAELQDMIKVQDEKLKVQAESTRNLEIKLAELQAALDLHAAEDRYTSARLAEHQIRIDELRRLLNDERAKVIEFPAMQRRGLN